MCFIIKKTTSEINASLMTNCEKTEKFVKKAKLVHGDQFDYSKSVYIHSKDKLIIICKVHGEFEQSANNHLKGHGCVKCSSKIETLPIAVFVLKAKRVHGDKYDYSKSVYTSASAKINILCRKHGEFEQRASNHLNGSECPKCAKNRSLTQEEFEAKAIAVHGDKYDYSNSVYRGMMHKVTIRCPEHGEFEQLALNHVRHKQDCPKCAINLRWKAIGVDKP